MKNFIKPLLFLTVLFLLAGVAYWDEWQSKKDEKEKTQKTKLVELKPSEVQAIDFEKRGEGGPGVKVSLAKEDGVWRIKSPVDYRADAATVDSWVKTLTELSFEKSFEASPEKLKDYGLAEPKITVALGGTSGQRVELKIGEKSPVGYSNYLRVEGKSPIYLVSQYAYTASNKELFDLRDKTFDLPDLQKLKSINYAHGNDPAFTLIKEGLDWRFSNTQSPKADADEVRGFIAFLDQLRVERFLDEPSPELAKALDGSNKGTVTLAVLNLVPLEGPELSYRFIENNGVVYAKLPQQKVGFVSLDKTALEGLKKSPKDFQSKAMFSFNSTEASTAEIDGKTFEKKGEQWIEQGANTDNTEMIRLLLVDLEFAKATEVLTRETIAPVLSEKPLHTMKFTFKEQKTVDISVWKNPAKPETIFLKRGDDGFFLTQATLLENFQEKVQPAEKAMIGGEG